MSKAVKTTCIICCLCLIVCAMAVPANALTYLNPDDYLHDITSDGTNKIARYDFSSLYSYIHTWDDATNVHADARWEIKYEIPRNAWTVLMDVFPLGGYQEPTALDWRSVALDVSDILPGSPLPISCRFYYEYKCATLTGDSATLHYSLGVYYFDAEGDYVGTVGGETGSYEIDAYTVDGFSELIEINGTFPADAHYVVPYLTLRTVFDDNEHDAYIYVRSEQFALDVTIDTVIENSNMMQSINDKLADLNESIGDVNDSLGDVNNSLGDVNDKLDDILNQPEQEKNDADQAGKDALEDVVTLVPDHSQGLADAFSGLASSMSYDGTVAKLAIPAVSMPGIDGLFEGFVIMQPTELDFEVYFDMLPENLLLLVQSLFTAALIVFCFKELYGTIQYCLTLRG